MINRGEAKRIIDNFNGNLGPGSNLLFVRKLFNEGFNDVQIATIISAMNETCHHCWNDSIHCQCWNDE